MASRQRDGLFKRGKSPFWYVSYVDEKGIRRKVSTKTTSKTEASYIRSQYVTGVIAPPQEETAKESKKARTIEEFSTDYLEVQKHLKSFATMQGLVKNISANLGKIPMDDLSAHDYEKYRAQRLTMKKPRPNQKRYLDKCSPATVNRELTILKHMFHKARSYGYITREAFERIADIKPLREDNKIIRYLTREEETALLDACKGLVKEAPGRYGHLYPIVLTALRTGMRKGEILALRREDVNIDKRIIHVVKSKSGKRRDVPIAQDLQEVLKTVLTSHCVEYVFWRQADERAEAYKDIKNSFGRALLKAGIDHFRFHDCRHHFASHFVMNGGNILHLQRILGHESVEMSMRYAHLSPDFIDEAIRIIDAHLGTGQDTQKAAV